MKKDNIFWGVLLLWQRYIYWRTALDLRRISV